MKIIFSFFLCLFFSFSIQAKQNIKYRNDTLASNFVRDNKQVGYSLFDENDFLISFHQDYLLFFYEGETYYFQAINNTEDYYRFQIKDGERNIGLLQIPESNFSSDSLTIYNLFIDFHFNFSKVKIKRELNFLPLDEEFIISKLRDTSYLQLKKSTFLIRKAQFFKNVHFYKASFMLLNFFLNKNSNKLIENPKLFLEAADLLWSLGKKEYAINLYKKFRSLLKKRNKKNCIPTYVSKRLINQN